MSSSAPERSARVLPLATVLLAAYFMVVEWYRRDSLSSYSREFSSAVPSPPLVGLPLGDPILTRSYLYLLAMACLLGLGLLFFRGRLPRATVYSRRIAVVVWGHLLLLYAFDIRFADGATNCLFLYCLIFLAVPRRPLVQRYCLAGLVWARALGRCGSPWLDGQILSTSDWPALFGPLWLVAAVMLPGFWLAGRAAAGRALAGLLLAEYLALQEFAVLLLALQLWAQTGNQAEQRPLDEDKRGPLVLAAALILLLGLPPLLGLEARWWWVVDPCRSEPLQARFSYRLKDGTSYEVEIASRPGRGALMGNSFRWRTGQKDFEPLPNALIHQQQILFNRRCYAKTRRRHLVDPRFYRVLARQTLAERGVESVGWRVTVDKQTLFEEQLTR